MKNEDMVLVIDKPHFVVKLHKTLLEVDLKEGIRKKLESALESNPKVRESLGFLFQTIIPLDVPLRNIQDVHVGMDGKVKLIIPERKDITIPLESNESEKLVEKMKELIAVEKEKSRHEAAESAKAKKEAEPKRARMQRDTYTGRMARV